MVKFNNYIEKQQGELRNRFSFIMRKMKGSNNL